MTIGILAASEGLDKRFIDEIGRNDIDIVKFGHGLKLSYTCVKQISQYIVERGINIIHSHNYKSDLYAFAASVFSRKKVGLVASNHNWILNSSREWWYKRMDSIIMNRFNALVAISSEIKEEMIDAGVSAKKIIVIMNGIDYDECARTLGRVEARKQLAIKDSDFVVGCVASLTPEKNHKDLIQAISIASQSIPQIKLVLIGDGPKKNEIENNILSNGLKENVLMIGSRDDVRNLYKAFDVFALASHREGLPMVLLEAMASGVPVIATSVGSIPEVIQDGENGILIMCGDIEKLIQAIISLFLQNGIRAIMGKNGAVTVQQKYSSERMFKEYERLYEQVLSSN